MVAGALTVSVLIFGAHPDDAEWGVGGTALLLARQNMSFAIVDMTRGEMGSRGTALERDAEALEAARFLGASARENMNLPDCGLVDHPSTRVAVASLIRKYRPKIVLAPYWEDRHPDHAAAGSAVRNSSLYCTLGRLESTYGPHKPAHFLYYLLHNYHSPTFVVDVSEVYARKLEALRLHASQFSRTAEQFGVLAHGMTDYLVGLESRDRFFGSTIGVLHGEALVSERPVRINEITGLLF